MSYCVALKLSRGLVFMSDTLTNGGLITFLSTLRHFLGGFWGKTNTIDGSWKFSDQPSRCKFVIRTNKDAR